MKMMMIDDDDTNNNIMKRKRKMGVTKRKERNKTQRETNDAQYHCSPTD